MNLRQLEILRAIIRNRTTTAAAEALGLSQPAVSNAIKLMEKQAGFALFERINNRLFPTPEALTLQEDGEAIFALHAGLENRVRDLRESKAGHLRLAATPPMGHGIIAVALRGFLARRPLVRVFLDVKRFEGVTGSVEAGLADLGFMLGEDKNAALTKSPLSTGNMVCVMPPHHELARKPSVTPEDLASHAFIALERGTMMGEAVRESFRLAACPFNFVIEARYCNTACALVESGVGIAVVDPFSPISYPSRNLTTRPFLPVTRIDAYATWSPNRPLSRLAETFLQEVRNAMNDTDMSPPMLDSSPVSARRKLKV